MRRSVRFSVIIPLAALACSSDRLPARGDKPRAGATTSLAPVPDSMAVHVRGPTLIAFYPTVTQAQVDSNEDLATVLDDFSVHLSAGRDSLLALGFTIVDHPPGMIRVIEGAVARDIALAPDSADVGFVFVAPGRRDRVLYGVTTGADLIDAGHKFLARVTTR
jgi:hypothetical protein